MSFFPLCHVHAVTAGEAGRISHVSAPGIKCWVCDDFKQKASLFQARDISNGKRVEPFFKTEDYVDGDTA